MNQKFYLSLLSLMLICSLVSGQLTGSVSYDFRDGTIISAGQSADGSLKLNGGSYKLHGTTYGLNMKIGGVIKIAVPGSSSIRFLGSTYSGLNMEAKTKSGVFLEPASKSTKVANDLSDTFDFVYSGAASDTLTFTLVAGSGNDLYLPKVEIVPVQLGKDSETAVKNIIYNFDLRDKSIIAAGGTATIDSGLFLLECGPSNAYGYHGTDHGSILKAANKITLDVAGNSYIKVGGCQYSNGTITASSTTGAFDKTSQSSKTTLCYHQDRSTVDFLYVGTAGKVVLDFSGTNYLPVIQIVPVPYTVELIPWNQKSGQVVVNGVAIDLSSGANSGENASVAVGSGTVVSATSDMASIRINLGGKTLSESTITYSGDISSVSASDDTLKITYADAASKPYSYQILVADNSVSVSAQPGKTYNYSFADGTILPQISYSSLRYNTFISADGLLTINSNTDVTAKQFGYHDSAHGAVMYSGNSMNFVVAGNATITIGTCQYGSATDAIFELTDGSGNVVGTAPAKDVTGVCESHSLSYSGPAGVLTATLKSTLYPNAEIYIHGISVENAAKIVKTVKIDAWDFGAAVLDTSKYNNKLTADIINSWYPGVDPGTLGKSLPTGFTAGVLSFVAGTNSDRIRTSNTSLTRYDANSCPAYVNNDTLTGLLYVNSSASSTRYIGLTLSADDEVTVYAKSQNGTGKLNFQYMADATQKEITPITSSVGIVKFVAKKGGAYHIFDSSDKPFYYRVLRKDATYVTLSGTLNLNDAPGIPGNFSVVMTNAAGKSWSDTITSGTNYSIKVPSGYTYSLSLADASGYIITNGAEITLENDAIREITIKKVEMYSVTGTITGLTTAQLNRLALTYTPSVAKIYVPEPLVDAVSATYNVQLEPNCQYTVAASGVNDFYIPSNTLTITGVTSADIAFSPKPVHKVVMNTPGLNEEQRSKLSLTFTNLNEAGYVYSFSKVDSTKLRDGVYKIATSGLDEYPLQLGPTSNLKVEGAETSKSLNFIAVTNWSFDDANIVNGTTTSYKGMLFTGTVYNEIAKGHLVIKDAATVKVPVNPGQKVVVTYYYSANFNIEGGNAVTTSSNSTNTFETTEYIYNGAESGYITIQNISGTTYLTEVTTAATLPYSSVITVGTDKQYQTIHAALNAARAMVRPNKERVQIMIDPGNYEEMLVVDIANISFVNAAPTPSIALYNKGVDIDANAVRITSYYGHGYNYFSMANNQKWNADALWVNKENGYLGYANTGSGTNNGSYWNATVVVSASGFEAKEIIFENSFNQYISKKESEDVVVEWISGGKGLRPTDQCNTSVQNKSFVERAAAIAFTQSGDKAVLDQCRIVGRQDSFYGAEGARVVAYKGVLMGGTDYIFGGMTLVCYQSDLAMNTSDAGTDVCYITAAQQNTSRGYLMYECTVTSALPGTETASSTLSKPGYLGRPWQATTSEVVFYNTTIKASDAAGFSGKSMIEPLAWLNTLGGASDKCYEYGTIEESGENNSSGRATWSHILTNPTLLDGTVINTFNFTRGTDNWDPIPSLITSAPDPELFSDVTVSCIGHRIFVSNVQSASVVGLYNLNGTLVDSREINADCNFTVATGFYIVKVSSSKGNKAVKVLAH